VSKSLDLRAKLYHNHTVLGTPRGARIVSETTQLPPSLSIRRSPPGRYTFQLGNHGHLAVVVQSTLRQDKKELINLLVRMSVEVVRPVTRDVIRAHGGLNPMIASVELRATCELGGFSPTWLGLAAPQSLKEFAITHGRDAVELCEKRRTGS
jgi:hypothetical protein